MKIAIMSDTHENEFAILKALKMIKGMKIDTILHCGDFVSPPTMNHFKDFKDLKLVFGNNDGEKEGLKKRAKMFDFDEPETTRDFELGDKRFFMAHEPFKVDGAIDSEDYDYVLYGHTHEADDRKIGKTRIINPGALFGSFYYTFAVLDLKTDELEFHRVEKPVY